MINIETLFFILTLSFVSPLGFSAPSEQAPLTEVQKSKLMGFQEWKKLRILEATLALDEQKTAHVEQVSKNDQQNQVDAVGAPDPQISADQAQLRFNLEIAQNLTIHDYFAIYLKDKTRQEMAQVISQLNPAEITELLGSYRDSLYGAPKDEDVKEQKTE